jgi:hypothetical protein
MTDVTYLFEAYGLRLVGALYLAMRHICSKRTTNRSLEASFGGYRFASRGMGDWYLFSPERQ